MKHFKLLLASALTLLIALVIATPANAAQDAQLKVTGLEEGDTVDFIQVVKWDPDNANQYGGWVATAGFETVLTKAVLKDVIGDPAATPAVAGKGIDYALAKQISDAYLNGATGGIKKPTATADNKGVVAVDIKATDLSELGLYIGFVNPVNTLYSYSPIFVSADQDGTLNTLGLNTTYDEDWHTTDGEKVVVAKRTTGSVVKTVTAISGDYQGDQIPNPDDLRWVTDRIGEKETFQVETTIPGYSFFTVDPTFIIRDNLTQLTLDQASVKVYSDKAQTNEIAPANYTLTTTDSSYQIAFKANFLKGLVQPTQVYVAYDATVSATATVHVDAQNNTVSTEFSNDPHNSNSKGYWKDETDHFTFTIDADNLGGYDETIRKSTHEIVKVALGKDGKPINQETIYSDIDNTKSYKSPLAGAEFKLYTDANLQNEYIPKDKNGVDLPAAPTYISGKDGRIGTGTVDNFEAGIRGLDEGVYYLVETKAPAGYIKSNAVVKFEIKADKTESAPITEWTKGDVDATTKELIWIDQDAYNNLSAADKALYSSYTYTLPILTGYHVFVNGVETASYTFTNKGTDIVVDQTTWKEIPTSIINTTGTELPSTGGMGTTIFYVVGSALVLCAGVLLVTKRRIARTEA